MTATRQIDTKKLVLLALLTATVVVLQVLAVVVRGPVFSLNLVLIPMVVGAVLISPLAGGWLGLVFGAVVLISGDANLFLAFNPFATVVVILSRGLFSGLAAGWVYKLLKNKGELPGVLAAAVICPIVNTGLFVAGMYVFFLPLLGEWGISGSAETASFIFLVMVGVNFLVELAINLILCSTTVRLVQYGKEKRLD